MIFEKRGRERVGMKGRKFEKIERNIQRKKESWKKKPVNQVLLILSKK